jgi:hypothetical protein
MGYDVTVERDEDGKAVRLGFSRQKAPETVATPVEAIPQQVCRARLVKWELAAGWFQITAGRCGYFVGARRKSGCCDAHKVRLWDEAHPRAHQARLPVVDEPAPSHDAEVRAMVLAVLADGKEHEPSDFCRASGLTWARINPRLRDLRKSSYGGFDIPSRLREIREDGVKIYVYSLRPRA